MIVYCNDIKGVFMANFRGTKVEFHKYFGGYCKNKINSMTSKLRKEQNGTCEYCGEHDELEAAHIQGQERKVIIDSILNEYVDNNGIIDIDVNSFEYEFEKRHLPINQHFYFLCKQCHRKYDNGEIADEKIFTKKWTPYIKSLSNEELDMLLIKLKQAKDENK